MVASLYSVAAVDNFVASNLILLWRTTQSSVVIARNKDWPVSESQILRDQGTKASKKREEFKCSVRDLKWKGKLLQTIFLRLISYFIFIHKLIHPGRGWGGGGGGGDLIHGLFAIKNNLVPEFMYLVELWFYNFTESVWKDVCVYVLCSLYFIA